MAMLNPSADAPQGAKPRGQEGSRASYISSGTQITGEIHGKTGLIVDGELKGKVELEDDVTIGASGKVNGDIVAQSVTVGGRVKGNVRGLKVVELQSTGRILGDVSAPRVVISEGAFFKGNVEMGEPSQTTSDEATRR